MHCTEMLPVVLLLLFIVPFTIADYVYYVIPDGHKHSCAMCHNLSYYISNPESYFTSDTTIIFLEGQHSFDREYLVYVSNVHNLTLKGQGQWPVAGPEETVMQSTVIINCTKERGGFYFNTSDSITVEGLTIVNCGGVDNQVAILFDNVKTLLFYRNSIQHMTGYGLEVRNCGNVTVSDCSYYHSASCNFTNEFLELGGGLFIQYNELSNMIYTLELSHSNMTKCCSYNIGGGIHIKTESRFGRIRLLFSDLILLNNYGFDSGGGLGVCMRGEGNVTFDIDHCLFANGSATKTRHTDTSIIDGGGAIGILIAVPTTITIQHSKFEENSSPSAGEISCSLRQNASLSILNSTIINTKTYSTVGVFMIMDTSAHIELNTMRIRLSNLSSSISCGICLALYDSNALPAIVNPTATPSIQIENCQFENCHNFSAIVELSDVPKTEIKNCTFSKNTNGQSVIKVSGGNYNITIKSSIISDNNMTGLTIISSSVILTGRNVIQNNRGSYGAGIMLSEPAYIVVHGELLMSNNTADKQGGAIYVNEPLLTDYTMHPCSIYFVNNSSSVMLSGNRAREGGSDMYGVKLMGCENYIINKHLHKQSVQHIQHEGLPNETSWYFDTPLRKYLKFSHTDRLSSLSSDPNMVCFCNTNNATDCSDRTHQIQSYPGLEISTSIATVGYYGGTSPGDVIITAQNATLARHYGQNKTINCFQLHILLQNTSSTTALVDIRVDGGLPGWNVSLAVEILECPLGFIQTSGECHCEPFLDANSVQCNVSLTPFKFARSGNGWFGHINNTQCVTGTTNCPFDYCNQSKLSFDIMAPDRQCVANRAGILCGQCQSHLSIMLGSNHCGTCSNWYLFLLPVFGLAGIVLIAMLMFLNMSVSVGTINGLLFYANMVKLNEAFFLPNGSVPVVSQFISWLNLDLGIEVCLFDGLDGYWNTWLQFVFPAYLFLLMGCIIVGCRYSVWLCRLCGSHAVPALATLFLMSYTKILITVANALSMYPLPCNDSILTVWSVDGNIEYSSGKHLVLLVFSCGILFVELDYLSLVMCGPLLEKYHWSIGAKIKPLLDAYQQPYKNNYQFWTGVSLLMRLVITVMITFTSGQYSVLNAYIITTTVVGILTFWSFTKGVYKTSYISVLETFYLLNLFFLSTATSALTSFRSKHSQIPTIISVSLSLIVCLVTVAVDLWQNFDFKKIKRKLGFKEQPEYIEVPQVAADEDDEPVGSPPSIVYGSQRGENRFVLEFRFDNAEEPASPSPVLIAREPLLFN